MSTRPSISLIIPTLNEEQSLASLLAFFNKNKRPEEDIEILVADGGSTDSTIAVARSEGATVIRCPNKGRASQMNFAAEHVTGDILYFVHADCLPPASFASDIGEAVRTSSSAGCFRFKFNGGLKLLLINSFLTRFSGIAFRGGDQTLFVKRSVFKELNGFNPAYVIMEEYDLIRRIVVDYKFTIIPKNVSVSPRKYTDNQFLKVTMANYQAMRMFLRGDDPLLIRDRYYKALKKLR